MVYLSQHIGGSKSVLHSRHIAWLSFKNMPCLSITRLKFLNLALSTIFFFPQWTQPTFSTSSLTSLFPILHISALSKQKHPQPCVNATCIQPVSASSFSLILSPICPYPLTVYSDANVSVSFPCSTVKQDWKWSFLPYDFSNILLVLLHDIVYSIRMQASWGKD